MIHSILITGGNSSERLKKANQLAESFLGKMTKNHPDFFSIEEKESIKISQIRELQKKLALKPYIAQFKIALINEAEKLTLPAQHSLLKTLEEPPNHSILILTALSRESLLPTVLSRCQIIRLPTALDKKINQPSIISHQSLAIKIINASPGERLLIAEKYAQKRDQTVEFCQNQLIAFRKLLRQKILSSPLSSNQPIIRNSQLTLNQVRHLLHQIQQSLELLQSNANPRLIIDNLLLSYPF